MTSSNPPFPDDSNNYSSYPDYAGYLDHPSDEGYGKPGSIYYSPDSRSSYRFGETSEYAEYAEDSDSADYDRSSSRSGHHSDSEDSDSSASTEAKAERAPYARENFTEKFKTSLIRLYNNREVLRQEMEALVAKEQAKQATKSKSAITYYENQKDIVAAFERVYERIIVDETKISDADYEVLQLMGKLKGGSRFEGVVKSFKDKLVAEHEKSNDEKNNEEIEGDLREIASITRPTKSEMVHMVAEQALLVGKICGGIGLVAGGVITGGVTLVPGVALISAGLAVTSVESARDTISKNDRKRRARFVDPARDGEDGPQIAIYKKKVENAGRELKTLSAADPSWMRGKWTDQVGYPGESVEGTLKSIYGAVKRGERISEEEHQFLDKLRTTSAKKLVKEIKQSVDGDEDKAKAIVKKLKDLATLTTPPLGKRIRKVVFGGGIVFQSIGAALFAGALIATAATGGFAGLACLAVGTVLGIVSLVVYGLHRTEDKNREDAVQRKKIATHLSAPKSNHKEIARRVEYTAEQKNHIHTLCETIGKWNSEKVVKFYNQALVKDQMALIQKQIENNLSITTEQQHLLKDIAYDISKFSRKNPITRSLIGTSRAAKDEFGGKENAAAIKKAAQAMASITKMKTSVDNFEGVPEKVRSKKGKEGYSQNKQDKIQALQATRKEWMPLLKAQYDRKVGGSYADDTFDKILGKITGTGESSALDNQKLTDSEFQLLDDISELCRPKERTFKQWIWDIPTAAAAANLAPETQKKLKAVKKITRLTLWQKVKLAGIKFGGALGLISIAAEVAGKAVEPGPHQFLIIGAGVPAVTGLGYILHTKLSEYHHEKKQEYGQDRKNKITQQRRHVGHTKRLRLGDERQSIERDRAQGKSTASYGRPERIPSGSSQNNQSEASNSFSKAR